MNELTLRPTASRQTKYATSVYAVLKLLKHATNIQILELVQEEYPEVSITTIHRVTFRLKEKGIIGCAPRMDTGSEKYDITPAPHHHFACATCNKICDIPDTDTSKRVIQELKNLSEECAITGTLTLRGQCKTCKSNDLIDSSTGAKKH